MIRRCPRSPAARAAGLALVLALGAWDASADEALDNYRKGISALEKGKCADAVRSFRAAIAKDGKENGNKKDYGVIFDKYYPHFQLAKALGCAGDTSAALSALDESRRQGVMGSGEIQSLRAQLEAKAPRAEATPTPSPSAAAGTQDPKAESLKLVDAANAAYRNGDMKATRAALEKAIALDPGNARAKALLGQLGGESDRSKEVERLLADAQRAAERKEYSVAKAKADEALKLDPDHPKARSLVQNLAVLVAAGTPSTTPTSAPTSTLTPMTPVQRAATELSIGKKLLADGKIEEAISRLEAARKLDSSNLEILPVLADAQKKREQQATLAKAAALLGEAKRLQAEGNLKDAKARAEQAKNLDPSNADARQLSDDLARLIATSSGSATPVVVDKSKLRDGVRLYFEGKYDDALRVLESGKAQLAETPSYHFYLGAIELSSYLLGGESDAKQKQRAEAAFRDARRLGYQPDATLHSPRIVAAFQSVPR